MGAPPEQVVKNEYCVFHGIFVCCEWHLFRTICEEIQGNFVHNFWQGMFELVQVIN